jgi:hypothetical protein
MKRKKYCLSLLKFYLLVSILSFVAFYAGAQVRLTTDALDSSAGNLSCYKIQTPRATYYLEKKGAGLSSLIDREGNDWISFHPKEGSGSGGEYRGFPNAVHQQDGSFFHPNNTGTDPSSTQVIHKSTERVTIQATSNNQNWHCHWDFYPSHCTFTMNKMPSDYKYWILYEGTPGGEYDDSDWYITSAIESKTPLTTPHNGDIPAPEWIAFGDRTLPRVLFLAHHSDDQYPDTFYQMNRQMTVFGFGRKGLKKYLNTVPQRFTIGFIEHAAYDKIKQTIKSHIQ